MSTSSKKWTFKEFMLRKTISKEKKKSFAFMSNKTLPQTRNSPKCFEKCKSQILFPQTSNPTSSFADENSASKSFDEFLNLLTTPEQSLPTVVPNRKKYFRKKSSSFKAQELSRHNSFEQTLDSFLKAKPSCSKTESQSNVKKNDLDFEEFMNSILTPDWHETPSQKTPEFSQKSNIFTKKSIFLNKTEVNADTKNNSHKDQQDFNQLLLTSRHSVFVNHKKSQIVPNVTTSQESLTDISSQNTEVDCDKDQSYFNELLIKSLSQNSKHAENREISQSDITIDLTNDTESEVFAVPVNDDEQSRNSFVSDIEMDQCEQSTTYNEQQSFDNTLAGGTSQNVPNLLNKSREIFTQTSFDEVLHLPQPGVLLNASEELNVLSQVPTTSEVSSQKPKRLQSSKNKNRSNIKNQEVINSEEHILRDLSKDVVFLPDGRKVFNSIDKIATDKWLQKAFQTVPNIATNKHTAQQQIYEFENLKSLYVDYLTKVTVNRYMDKNIKVCEIKTEPNVSNNAGDPETQFKWNIKVVENSKETEFAKQLRVGVDKICADPVLAPSACNLERIDKNKIQFKIHSIFVKVYDAFENHKMPCLVVPHDQRCNLKTKAVRFKSRASRKRFCRLLFMLAKIYTLIQTKRKLTKREIFYQVKHICLRQGLTNDAIELASRVLGVGHWHFNVMSQSGLVYGDLKLVWSSGETTNCNSPATLVPNDMEELAEVRSNASFILIVEKESIFHLLLEEDLPNKLARPFILVTGKGVPSINTRLFINRLSRLLVLPVFILCDPDVYGIRIMLTYRFGSFANQHLHYDLALPNARWLGVFPSEIVKYNLPNEKLSKTDKRVINSLLNYSYMEHLPVIAGEVALLLLQNMKASIEGLILNDTFLSKSYLPLKFYNQDFL